MYVYLVVTALGRCSSFWPDGVIGIGLTIVVPPFDEIACGGHLFLIAWPSDVGMIFYVEKS